MASALAVRRIGFQSSDRAALAYAPGNTMAQSGVLPLAGVSSSAAETGTLASGTIEQDVRTGGRSLITTLTDETWAAAGSAFDDSRAAQVAGLDSEQAEVAGWDAVVKAYLAAHLELVVRTSATVRTIGPLPAFPTFQITATETITDTIPATALVGAVAIGGAPTFTVTRGADDLVQPVGLTQADGTFADPGSLSSDAEAHRVRLTATCEAVTLGTRTVRIVP